MEFYRLLVKCDSWHCVTSNNVDSMSGPYAWNWILLVLRVTKSRIRMENWRMGATLNFEYPFGIFVSVDRSTRNPSDSLENCQRTLGTRRFSYQEDRANFSCCRHSFSKFTTLFRSAYQFFFAELRNS